MGKKTDRIMAMLSLIPREPAKISTDRLMGFLSDAGYAVTQRTIQRDLQELSATHPIVLDERSKPYGWSYMAGYNARNESMNPFEALAFIIASREFASNLPSGIAQYLLPQEQAAKRALDSFSSSLASFDKKVARVPRGFSLMPAEIKQSILDAVYDGLLREKVLVLDYATKKQVKVHPLGLVFRDQITYIVCTFWDYEDIRQLALHRVKTCTVTNYDAHTPKDFSLKRYEQTGAFGYLHSDEKINLELKMTIDAAGHLRETPISENQKIVDSNDGWVTVTATVPDREDLRWWVLGFGDYVEVISPGSFRKQIHSALIRAAKNYEL
jgi:predicted DNA-binding transcriptional regulator YafY